MAYGANAAILYRPEAFTTQGTKLMGRQAAGEGFVRGFVRHANVERLFCYAARREHAEHFTAAAQAAGNTRPVTWLNEADPRLPAAAGTLYLPDPSLSAHAWRRRRFDQRAYSIVGITHTIASASAMDWIVDQLTSPVQEWDAQICTSRVARQSLEFMYAAQSEFLAARLGATRIPRPRLPVIPLGIDTDRFAPDPQRRAEARQAFGIADDEAVVLFAGRLSFHAKAHPLPMYLALEKVAHETGRRIRLIQAGLFANDFIEGAFKSGAAQLCPSVDCTFVDGRDAVGWRQAWHAADLFTSLSDNIQETFGLAPVEAMAAALPSVVTDWNGYRDTIRDGIDGIRVPTLMPPPAFGEDLADRHAAAIDDYDHYTGFTSQFVAVDPEACAAAYARLLGDEALRRRMGAAARQRAVAEFDWRAVVARYQELWAELAETRRGAAESAPRAAGHPANPARADPYQAFASYATAALAAGDRVALAPGASGAAFDAIVGHALVAFAERANPAREEMHRVIDAIGRQENATVATLAAGWPEERRALCIRSLLWLAKLGLVRIARPG
ncbi:MAG TPA: glycosyltransferase family 4 protein [Dongiaceae bacterium]|nr:glycosyltransferase family 4 protein [Dongiaceae bacterium]